MPDINDDEFDTGPLESEGRYSDAAPWSDTANGLQLQVDEATMDPRTKAIRDLVQAMGVPQDRTPYRITIDVIVSPEKVTYALNSPVPLTEVP